MGDEGTKLEEVWLSKAFTDSRILADFITPEDVFDTDHKDFFGPNYQAAMRYLSGIPLSDAERPTKLLQRFHHTVPKPDLPLMYVSAPLFGDKKLAELLSKFQFGSGCNIYPVPVFDYEGKAELEDFKDNCFCLNIAAQKSSFLPHQSIGLKVKQNDAWRLPLTAIDDDIAVSTSALTGVDFWMEQKLSRAIFMSGRLAHAIKDAGLEDCFKLRRCRVLEVSDV
jgi:hypothetical protein